MEKFIKNFSEISISDIPEVGGKNASLGEMFNALAPKGILIPKGFAVTASAFKYFLDHNNLRIPLKDLLSALDRNTFINLQETGRKARALMLSGELPEDLSIAITNRYEAMFNNGTQAVAVRSSATAEDLPQASFAGQHESYLNIKGSKLLLNTIKQCFASLYTDRAIKYREDQKFAHDQVLLSVGVQEMIRSDLGCSGVGFTLEPESGFKNVVHIAGVWGLGENIVQGTVSPDEFLVYKPAIRTGHRAMLQKKLGSKDQTMIYASDQDLAHIILNQETSKERRDQFVLDEKEVEKLARWSMIIEEHYNRSMDFEWAKDGMSGELYILQARPETVHQQVRSATISSYKLKSRGTCLTKGLAIGNQITSGVAKILSSPAEMEKLNVGDILVTENTSPDWDPIFKKVSGVITNKGGRTSHAAIIARELGAVAIVGTENATSTIQDGDLITLSCAEGRTGYVYKGKLEWEKNTIDTSTIVLPDYPKAQLIIGDPDQAFKLSFLPNHGVGLLRMEFMISNYIKVHPMALLHPEQVTDKRDLLTIGELTNHYQNPEDFFVEKLTEGIGIIAAAFAPKDVIVRMSDFKTNEYAGLIGGNAFEPKEENPMIGFRGAARYYNARYKEAFELECKAIKVVRDHMGLTNVKVMIPFCRTVEEGEKVIALMEEFSLKRGQNGLEIFVMAELPANVILATQFAKVFDGFSIGSNDLTQLTLGVDRDSELVAELFNEENAAVGYFIEMMISKAKESGKHCGLCGQAASDSLLFTKGLVKAGIDSIAFNANALIKGIDQINIAIREKG